MSLADRRRVRPEHHLRQDGAEALVEADVDGAVDGRVGDDQGVADAAEVELESAAVSRRVRQEVPRQLRHERRKLADAEHDHDDDQDQGDVVVMTNSSSPSSSGTFLLLLALIH